MLRKSKVRRILVDLVRLSEEVLQWASKPGNHGGNPYQHRFVQRAIKIDKALMVLYASRLIKKPS